MEKKITVIKGDGIGPEIVTEAQKVLDKVAEKFGHKFVYTDILMGGCSIDKYGVPLTDEAVEIRTQTQFCLALSAEILPLHHGISLLRTSGLKPDS